MDIDEDGSSGTAASPLADSPEDTDPAGARNGTSIAVITIHFASFKYYTFLIYMHHCFQCCFSILFQMQQ